MTKILIQTDQNKVVPLLGDDDGQVIVRPDHDEKIIGYEDQLFQKKSEYNAAAGINILTSTTVPAGYVWFVSGINAWNANNDFTTLLITPVFGGVPTHVFANSGPLAGIPDIVLPNLYLIEDDYIQATFTGCTLNDNIFMSYWGYKYKIP